MSNYEVRCSILHFCRPKDTVMLMKALESITRLTRREKKDYLGLYTLIFKDDDLIYELCKSGINITVVCKDLDDLLQIYYDPENELEERVFEVMIILSNEYEVVPLYSDMIGKVFAARTLCPITVRSK